MLDDKYTVTFKAGRAPPMQRPPRHKNAKIYAVKDCSAVGVTAGLGSLPTFFWQWQSSSY